MGNRAVAPKGEAKEDWAIIRALSSHIDRLLPYDSLSALREKLFADHPSFASINHAPGHSSAVDFDPSKLGAAGKLNKAAFASPLKDFYLTNPIARSSNVMAECSEIQSNLIKEAAE